MDLQAKAPSKRSVTTRGPSKAPESGSTATRCAIAGGHIQIGTRELVLAWAAYASGCIRSLDFRVWLASYELAKRRSWMRADREASWTPRELYGLVGGGGGERGIRASLARLGRISLLTWEKSGPKFASELEQLAPEFALQLEAPVREMQEWMPKRRRFFPLQRRILRVLAGGVKRSVLASVLGHSIRCIFWDKKSGWNGTGACSASWVANAFRVGESSVRRARAHLIGELSWLRACEADQWFINRHGGRFEVNLGWEASAGNAHGNRIGNDSALPSKGQESRASKGQERGGTPSKSTSTPTRPLELSTARMRGPLEQNEPGLRGPVENRPLPKGKIQESDPGPERARPRADSCREGGGGGKTTRSVKLTDIQPEDLRSIGSVMELYDQALASPTWQSRGWSPQGDLFLERLNWAAAAHRARMRGGENPVGLFVHLVSKRLWGHVTNDDEDAVRAKMSAWRDGVPEETYTRPTIRSGDEYEDACVPADYVSSLVVGW